MQACAERQQEMVLFLEKLVNIDSMIDNPEGTAQIAKILGAKLQKMGFSVETFDGGDLPTNLLARKKSANPDAKTILVLGHMDTVFKKGTVAERPFTIIGDKAYGPGVVDMKSGITLALFALENLYSLGWDKHNIVICFAGDEEYGHPDTNFKQRLMEVARECDLAFNMETGFDNGDVVIARRGVMYPVIQVEGISAHAGKDPEKGANAIRELAYKIEQFYGLDDPVRGTNFNAGVIRGGIIANGVAGYAELESDFRFNRAKDQPHIVEQLEKVIAEVHVPKTKTTMKIDDVRTFLPMEKVEGTDKILDVVKEQAKKVGLDINGIMVGSGSDSCWVTYVGTPIICAMGGRGGMSHGEKEYLHLNSLTDKSQIFALTLQYI